MKKVTKVGGVFVFVLPFFICYLYLFVGFALEKTVDIDIFGILLERIPHEKFLASGFGFFACAFCADVWNRAKESSLFTLVAAFLFPISFCASIFIGLDGIFEVLRSINDPEGIHSDLQAVIADYANFGGVPFLVSIMGTLTGVSLFERFDR